MTPKPHSIQDALATLRREAPQAKYTIRRNDFNFALAHVEGSFARLKEQFEVADAFARVADDYCWDPETTTHDDLMNARAEWQTRIGRMKLAARGSNPAISPKEDA